MSKGDDDDLEAHQVPVAAQDESPAVGHSAGEPPGGGPRVSLPAIPGGWGLGAEHRNRPATRPSPVRTASPWGAPDRADAGETGGHEPGLQSLQYQRHQGHLRIPLPDGRYRADARRPDP